MYGAYKNIRRFQSLVGFKINWNSELRTRLKDYSPSSVSIPSRV